MSLSRVPSLFEELPAPLAGHFDPERPWDLLGSPLEGLLETLPSSRLDVRLLPEVHLLGDRIVIQRGVRVAPGVVIEGPVFIGAGTVLRPGASVRGGSWIGEGCVVGANSEIKHSILLDGARAPHLNYVGDSILGRRVNLGAGTVLSNFRHDGGEIHVTWGEKRICTGRRKLGAVLGDDVLTGCNSVLHPGCIVGRKTQIYPGVQLRSGFYPERSLVKLVQQLEIVPRRG